MYVKMYRKDTVIVTCLEMPYELILCNFLSILLADSHGLCLQNIHVLGYETLAIDASMVSLTKFMPLSVMRKPEEIHEITLDHLTLNYAMNKI